MYIHEPHQDSLRTEPSSLPACLVSRVHLLAHRVKIKGGDKPVFILSHLNKLGVTTVSFMWVLAEITLIMAALLPYDISISSLIDQNMTACCLSLRARAGQSHW